MSEKDVKKKDDLEEFYKERYEKHKEMAEEWKYTSIETNEYL